MDERHAAESEIAQSRDRIGDLAEELSRRVSPSYVSARAKEQIVMKTSEWKDRAAESPKTYQAAGAVAGWFIAKALFQWMQERQYYNRSPRLTSGYGYGESYGSYDAPEFSAGDSDTSNLRSKVSDTAEGVKDKVSDVAQSLKSKATGAMDSVTERTQNLRARTEERIENVRHRIPEARQRVSGAYHRALEEQPLVVILGALFVGSVAALLVPVTDRERQVLSPAKEKVKEQIQKVTDAVEAKVGGQENEQSTQPIAQGPGSSSGAQSEVSSIDANLPSVH